MRRPAAQIKPLRFSQNLRLSASYYFEMIKIREMEDGIVVSVKVQPNSSKDRVVGEYADQIKIAVTVAPEKGKANKAVIKLFAKWLGIKNSDIQIISGETSRDKELFIRNITEEDLYKLVSQTY